MWGARLAGAWPQAGTIATTAKRNRANRFIDRTAYHSGPIAVLHVHLLTMDRRTIWRVWLPLAGGLLALGSVFHSGPGPRGSARLFGLLLALIGLAGVILARYTLGRSFSIAPKATALVTSGIYSRIRNPIYVFAAIFLIGLALIVGRPKLLVILAVLIPMQIVRARREAAVLEAKFGDAYREYRKHTWF